MYIFTIPMVLSLAGAIAMIGYRYLQIRNGVITNDDIEDNHTYASLVFERSVYFIRNELRSRITGTISEIQKRPFAQGFSQTLRDHPVTHRISRTMHMIEGRKYIEKTESVSLFFDNIAEHKKLIKKVTKSVSEKEDGVES